MIRRIIQIDEERCTGCELCVHACHEGAIGMVDGKAKLLRDDYCDGLGDCLPACPAGAITFVEREAVPYDEEAVLRNRAKQMMASAGCQGGCPGSAAKELKASAPASSAVPAKTEGEPAAVPASEPVFSMLRNWPVQIKLAPIRAPYFQGAHLLIAADCAAFAHANFNQEFMEGKITFIGCPKLDGVDYTEKLAAILSGNAVESVTIVRMEVPCCGGLERAVAQAVQNAAPQIPATVTVMSLGGRIIRQETLQ